MKPLRALRLIERVMWRARRIVDGWRSGPDAAEQKLLDNIRQADARRWRELEARAVVRRRWTVRGGALAIIVLTLGGIVVWRYWSADAARKAAAAPLRHVERVFAASGGGRAWGSVCRLERGAVTAAHVVRDAMIDARVDLDLTPIDAAFLDGADWRAPPETVPALRQGDPVLLVGYPAGDRDGEILPGVVGVNDTTPPGVWIEMTGDAAGPPEGVLGGMSGGCVLKNDRPAGVIVANSFSQIEGATGVWALIIPLQAALRAAQSQGEVP